MNFGLSGNKSKCKRVDEFSFVYLYMYLHCRCVYLTSSFTHINRYVCVIVCIFIGKKKKNYPVYVIECRISDTSIFYFNKVKDGVSFSLVVVTTYNNY